MGTAQQTQPKENVPSETTVCPGCGSAATQGFLLITAAPANIGRIYLDREEARQAARGDIALSYCYGCTLIFNRAFDPTLVEFIPGYEVSLHHSPRYRNFIDEVVEQLVTRYRLQHKNVIEVGCGGGYFLQRLCAVGRNRGVGFDPSVEVEGHATDSDLDLRFVRDTFDERYADLDIDFLVCRHVLQVVAHPREFVAHIRQALGDRHEAPVYFELPNADYIFGGTIPWGIFYEAHTYFSPRALQQLFETSGFRTLALTPCYASEQYLAIEALPTEQASTPPPPPRGKASASLPSHLIDFGASYESLLRTWRETLAELLSAQKKVVAWGAGGRGISFLNALETGNQIAYVADINPERQGGFLPGTAQAIVAPSFLQQYRPDTVILTNPTYEQEVRQQLLDLGIDCVVLSI